MALNFMPFYTGDFLRDTLELSASEVGSYMLLIVAYWNNGGPLLYDINQLAQIARCKNNPKKLEHLVSKYFEHRDNTIFHKRVELELARSRNAYAKRSAAARKANAKKARGVGNHNHKVMVEGNTTSEPTASSATHGLRTDAVADNRVQVTMQDGTILKINPYGICDHVWSPPGSPDVALTTAQAIELRNKQINRMAAE